ncbi:hypothetical protein Hanom_Chr07g00659391 [Helianthus anomalus]
MLIFACFSLCRFELYHPYAISIRVILELFIKCQGIYQVYQSVSKPIMNGMKCYTIELDWTRFFELTR